MGAIVNISFIEGVHGLDDLAKKLQFRMIILSAEILHWTI